jgi:thiamine-monophosphate kinase
MDELTITERFKRLPQGPDVLIGPGDDAALIKPAKKQILFCGDMFIEDVHFRLKKISFEDIGFRACARTLSDIAAMAGLPKFIGVSVGLPKKHSAKALTILNGIKKIARRFKVSIVGGDLSKAEKIFVDIWCLGYVEKKRAVRRKGAKAGEALFVSGRLGTSYKLKPRFIPRIKEARFLSKNFSISSMIDISDGLILDLWRMLKESKKSAVLCKEKIPINPKADLNAALYAGEDYELLFTAPKKEIERLKKAGFYHIGQITKGKAAKIFLKEPNARLKALKQKGYLSL